MVAPIHATLSSCGSSRWQPADWFRNPFQFGISVISSGGASWTFDATVDDPSGSFPNPLLNPGAPNGKNVAIYNSSQLAGSSQSGGASGGVTISCLINCALELSGMSSYACAVAGTWLKGAARMDEAKNIVQLNIAYYRELLVSETDPKKRVTINRLLAEQEAKLQEMERNEGG